jgi:hypothetical protein
LAIAASSAGGWWAALSAPFSERTSPKGFRTHWEYYNLFQPVLHLVGKEVVDGKLKRRWDLAQTPYQRLLASGTLFPRQQERLAALPRQHF